MMKNIRKDIVKGIEEGEGWKPLKLTKKAKKALERGRVRSADSTCPFDLSSLGSDEPLRDQHGNPLDEEWTVVIPKAAGKK